MTDAELVSKMREIDGPAVVVSELADEFDMTEEGIRNRLETLAKEGDINKKKASSRVVIWWCEENHDASPFPPLE